MPQESEALSLVRSENLIENVFHGRYKIFNCTTIVTSCSFYILPELQTNKF
jgi:hypothetical protein